jgi:hypothetical protein
LALLLASLFTTKYFSFSAPLLIILLAIFGFSLFLWMLQLRVVGFLFSGLGGGLAVWVLRCGRTFVFKLLEMVVSRKRKESAKGVGIMKL